MNTWGPTGDLPLDLALRAHNASIANTLVQHHADVNSRDSYGDTLLHRAIKNDDSFAAVFLLNAGADGGLPTRNDGDTALHLIASTTTMEDTVKICDIILDKHVNPNIQNKFGM